MISEVAPATQDEVLSSVGGASVTLKGVLILGETDLIFTILHLVHRIFLLQILILQIVAFRRKYKCQ